MMPLRFQIGLSAPAHEARLGLPRTEVVLLGAPNAGDRVSYNVVEDGVTYRQELRIVAVIWYDQSEGANEYAGMLMIG